MIRSRPYALHVLSAVLIVASLVLATALVVEVPSVQYQANVGETSRLEASALLLSDRYVAALRAGSPAAPLVRGNLPLWINNKYLGITFNNFCTFHLANCDYK